MREELTIPTEWQFIGSTGMHNTAHINVAQSVVRTDSETCNVRCTYGTYTIVEQVADIAHALGIRHVSGKCQTVCEASFSAKLQRVVITRAVVAKIRASCGHVREERDCSERGGRRPYKVRCIRWQTGLNVSRVAADVTREEDRVRRNLILRLQTVSLTVAGFWETWFSIEGKGTWHYG